VSTTADILPADTSHSPADPAELRELVRSSIADNLAIYPVGGGTSLQFGCPPWKPGVVLATTSMNRVVDYPARDMTITVQSGITMSELSATLAAERQRLPVDVPEADRATLGGVLATNTNGPRRFGCGTIRDYTIGISAIDGNGRLFRGGGQVVKNVAGYDFCKLLVGSLGSLGVISQVTLKVVPEVEASCLVARPLRDVAEGETLLADLLRAEVMPTAIEWVDGPGWDDVPVVANARGAAGCLLAGLEGTRAEVDWMRERLVARWQDGDGSAVVASEDESDPIWKAFAEFPADSSATLVVKATVVSSAVAGWIERLRQFDSQSSVMAHAGSGVVIGRLTTFEAADVSKVLIGSWQAEARKQGGHLTILSGDSSLPLTRQAIWGGGDAGDPLLRAVGRQFDPQGLMNPGRLLPESE